MQFKSQEELKEYFTKNSRNNRILTELVIEFDGYTGTSLPEIPDTVIDLRILNCLNLKTCPTLPVRLSRLVVDNCPELTELPPMSGSISTLLIHNCIAMKNLHPMPDSLTHLLVDGCPGLTRKNVKVGKLTIWLR